jgi:hypothetical protein
MHGNNTRNLLVQLSLSQTSKTAMFFLISFMVFLQQNQRTREWNRFCSGREGDGGANNVYTCAK